MKNRIQAYRNGATKPAPSQPKSPKPGKEWIAVNCSSWEEARLRKIARAGGLSFRMFCGFALHHAASIIEKELGLGFGELSALTKTSVEGLHKKSLLIRSFSMRLPLHPERN